MSEPRCPNCQTTPTDAYDGTDDFTEWECHNGNCRCTAFRDKPEKQLDPKYRIR